MRVVRVYLCHFFLLQNVSELNWSILMGKAGRELNHFQKNAVVVKCTYKELFDVFYFLPNLLVGDGKNTQFMYKTLATLIKYWRDYLNSAKLFSFNFNIGEKWHKAGRLNRKLKHVFLSFYLFATYHSKSDYRDRVELINKLAPRKTVYICKWLNGRI